MPEILGSYEELLRSKGGITFAVFRDIIRDLMLQFKKPGDRHYVLLSLDEAEHLRGIMHGRQGLALLPSEISSCNLTTLAMWIMGDEDMTVLGNTYGFVRGPAPQHSSMVNSYRFVNSDVYFNDRSLNVLLRLLEDSSCDSRQKWWTDVRSCRRRRQIALDGAVPVVTLFTTKSEFEFMEYKSEVARIQYELEERGLLVYDAFRAFNASNSGLMNCSELYGGVTFLGIPFTPEQIYEFVKRIAIDNEVGVLLCGNGFLIARVIFSTLSFYLILCRVWCLTQTSSAFSRPRKKTWSHAASTPRPTVASNPWRRESSPNSTTQRFCSLPVLC